MQPGVPVERVATKGSQGGAGSQGASFGRGPQNMTVHPSYRYQLTP